MWIDERLSFFNKITCLEYDFNHELVFLKNTILKLKANFEFWYVICLLRMWIGLSGTQWSHWIYIKIELVNTVFTFQIYVFLDEKVLKGYCVHYLRAVSSFIDKLYIYTKFVHYLYALSTFYNIFGLLLTIIP